MFLVEGIKCYVRMARTCCDSIYQSMHFFNINSVDDRMNDIIEFLKRFGYNKLEERVRKDYWFKK